MNSADAINLLKEILSNGGKCPNLVSKNESFNDTACNYYGEESLRSCNRNCPRLRLIEND